MKNRAARDFNLRAIFQHFSDMEIVPFTPRICLGAMPKPKTRANRLYIL